MSVDHRCFNIILPRQFLNRADVIAIFEQMSGERMSEGMTRNSFINFRIVNFFLYSSLDKGGSQVMTTFLSRFPVSPSPFLGKNPLPKPISRTPRILFPQSIRYEYLAPSFHLVLLKKLFFTFSKCNRSGSFRDSGNIVRRSLASFPFRIKISL